LIDLQSFFTTASQILSFDRPLALWGVTAFTKTTNQTAAKEPCASIRCVDSLPRLISRDIIPSSDQATNSDEYRSPPAMFSFLIRDEGITIETARRHLGGESI
jgi:hypothetical protein